MNDRVKDLTGKTFTRLSVLHRAEGVPKGKYYLVKWVCKCVCGKITVVRGDNLRSGHAGSCGCLALQMKTKHGDALPNRHCYGTWRNMIERCENPNSTPYRYYGAKGITVNTAWRNDYRVFKTWAMENGWEKGLVIDRLDPKGNYEPGNCQFLTRSENAKKQWRQMREAHYVRGPWLRRRPVRL